jgi:hypothetical protein
MTMELKRRPISIIGTADAEKKGAIGSGGKRVYVLTVKKG